MNTIRSLQIEFVTFIDKTVKYGFYTYILVELSGDWK